MNREQFATIIAEQRDRDFFSGQGGTRINLCQADLRGLDLHGYNLENFDLEHANLQDVDLHWANLRNTNLNMAQLWGVNLSGAIGILSIGPIGSHKSILYIVQHSTARMYKTERLWCDEAAFLAAVLEDHGDNEIALAYRAAVELARLLLPVEGEADAR